MLRSTKLFALIVLVLVILVYHCRSETVAVRSKVDGGYYNVLKEYPNRQEAADLLARCNVNILSFLKYLKNKYHIDRTDDEIRALGSEYEWATSETRRDVWNMMNTLLDRYNYETLYENNPRNLSGDTSYTLNKGDKMFLCLRRKDDPLMLIDYNTLMFCCLHESAHIANYNGWGHPTRFWTVMRLILYEASAFGIYQPVDYARFPVDYCGLRIEYMPLYDDTLPKLWEL